MIAVVPEPVIFNGLKSSFTARVRPARGFYFKIYSMSEESREWSARLPELWEKEPAEDSLLFNGIRGPGKGVAVEEMVRERVYGGHSAVVSQVGTGAERCRY